MHFYSSIKEIGIDSPSSDGKSLLMADHFLCWNVKMLWYHINKVTVLVW